MIYPRPPKPYPPRDEEWDSCWLCGGNVHDEVEIRFDAGAVEPTEGETLTGANSNDTGVVSNVWLESGAYANNNAVGTITLTSPTGIDANGLWGTDDELLHGSTGGNNMMALNDNGFKKTYGRLWPKGMLIYRDGRNYCLEHYAFRFYKKDLDNAKINIKD